ncbi:hypothetical protein ACQP0I_08800 [Micromonospora carbonacea]|uniref:hypothetical protein n=1 Tax=Micromonospora carbonacea TaxID=47853 RepID=UPI003D96C7E2
MTAAPILPERHEWTVDDLGDLPKDLPYELINGRLIVPSPTALHQDSVSACCSRFESTARRNTW